MKYQTAVSRLRSLAEEFPRVNVLADEPLLVGAYAFGDLLDGKDDLQVVHLALVVNMPTEQLTWYADPPETQSIARFLRLGKFPLEWYLRPVGWPVWNHYIRGPVRFWSVDGPDEETLQALSQRRFEDLQRQWPDPAEEQRQLAIELTAAMEHLKEVTRSYWKGRWRRDHKEFGVYPEDYLWRAAHGYLDLQSAVEARSAV